MLKTLNFLSNRMDNLYSNLNNINKWDSNSNTNKWDNNSNTNKWGSNNHYNIMQIKTRCTNKIYINMRCNIKKISQLSFKIETQT